MQSGDACDLRQGGLSVVARGQEGIEISAVDRAGSLENRFSIRLSLAVGCHNFRVSGRGGGGQQAVACESNGIGSRDKVTGLARCQDGAQCSRIARQYRYALPIRTVNPRRYRPKQLAPSCRTMSDTAPPVEQIVGRADIATRPDGSWIGLLAKPEKNSGDILSIGSAAVARQPLGDWGSRSFRGRTAKGRTCPCHDQGRCGAGLKFESDGDHVDAQCAHLDLFGGRYASLVRHETEDDQLGMIGISLPPSRNVAEYRRGRTT